MISLASVAGFCAGWNTLYSNSSVVSTTVTTVHILSLLFAGGLAIATDRTTLRATDDDLPRVARELAAVHRPVLGALSVLFLSGVLLAAADVETFLVSPLFWIKLGLVALLLINGAALAVAESRYSRMPALGSVQWRRLRGHAWSSIALWVATTIAGTILVNAA